MKNFFHAVNDFFLRKVDQGNFVLYRKGQFLMSMNLVFIGLMILLSIAAIALPPERAAGVRVLALIATIVTVIILMVLKTGRVQGGLNSFAVFTAMISIAGFITKPPHLAGVSLAYFMLMGLAYTSLFCSVRLTVILLLSFIAAHVGYYFFIALPTAEGLIIETVKTTLLDGIITLLGTFTIGVAASRILNRALEITVDESNKNIEQYKKLSTLNSVMNETFVKINESINVTSDVVENFSDTFQNQAATFEELAASMEEISANTTNVAFASKTQNDSVVELFKSFDVLANSVDKLEIYGREISEIFDVLLRQAKDGESSSAKLNSSNSKISDNSEEILSVVTVMEEFFDKINLLALNATIEAARAGEYGRGFAVVAEEIGKMADSSSRDLKQIWGLVEKNRKDVEEGNKNITEIIDFIYILLQHISRLQEKSVLALGQMKQQKIMKEEMNNKAETVRSKSELIETSMNEQESAIADIVMSIENFNTMLQSNTESVNHLRETSQDLKKLAEQLEKTG